jgi:hypothetical protein
MQKTRSAADEQLLANLATECAERIRNGEKVNMAAYRSQLPDKELRQEFDELVSWSTALTALEDAKRSAI